MAYSPIEDKYLSALTAVQFPDAPIEPEMPEESMPGRQQGDVMLAAGPSGTASDAGQGMGEIKPIPRNAVVGGIASFVRDVRDMANQYEIKDWVPLLGSMGVGDLLLGKSPEEIENWAYGNSPFAMPPSGTGGYVPIVKTGRKEGLADVLSLGIDAAPIGKALSVGGKVATKTGKALAPKAAEMIIEGVEKLGTPVRGLNIVELGPRLPKVVSEDQVETPNFKNWFGDWQAAPESASKVVDDKGTPLAVFHGTARPDRVGTNFKKSRATSGPMSFFTDDPEIASGYAKGKQDTSLAYEETDYANWFKKKDGRSTINIDQAGARMSSEERQSVLEKLRDINMTDDGEIVYQPGGGTIMSRDSFDFYLQREAKGNPLKLAKQLWLESGTLYNDEEKFAKVLQLAGVKGFDADFPNASYPAVYKVFLDIKNPLDTSAIPQEVLADLEATASRIRKRSASSGADMWDKNTIPPKEWIARLKGDKADGTTHSWTSIPDWVTERLKVAGYDGIKDAGGKSIGQKTHTVWIPFEETQVKSAMGNIGTFDPSKKNILRGAGAGGTATGTATMQDKENK